ncbi:MAG: FtsX-like permease family protein, partial [Gammaproteobacteria bacterium]|nr:FtsX-like permease family protein [Gammaproteobacteria bacterium]
PTGLHESYFVDLRLKFGAQQSTPIIEGHGVARDYPGYSFKLMGTDSFSEMPFRDFSAASFTNTRNEPDAERGRPDNGDLLTRLLTEPGTTLIAENRARALGLGIGDSLNLRLGSRDQSLTLIGYIPITDSKTMQALDNLLLMDIATAQEVLALPQHLSRIELIIGEDDRGTALLSRIEQSLPAGAQIISVQSSNSALSQMTRAFRTNLTAMSLLALMVGLFIIYNGISFSVVQRREMFAVLRVLGVTGKELSWIIYAEAILLGIVGTVLGLLLGILLGYGLLELVTRTVSDLYNGSDSAALSVSFASIIKGMALGLGATLLAAVLPAREALTIVPQLAMQRMQLESKTLKILPRLARLGLWITAAGLLVLLFSERSLVLSFGGLFMLVIGYSLLVPQTVAWMTTHLRSVLGRLFGLKGHMALHSVSRSLSRTSVAMAALTVAVATTLGVTVMIDSFRGAVDSWITQSMRADVYIAVPGIDRHVALSNMDAALIERITQLDQVKYISKARRTVLQTSSGEIELLAFDLPEKSLEAFTLIEGEQERAWQSFSTSPAAIISEPYAYRHKLSAGDKIQLPTLLGQQTFDIVGVYSDYASERGRVVIALDNYQHYWRDAGISSIGLYLEEKDKGNSGEERLVKQLRQMLPTDSPLSITTKKGIREATLTVFDRTFAITEVLRILTVFVAFVGILSALMALQLERAREFAMLRATGLTPGELRQLVISETGLIGLLIGIIALPLGILLSAVLIHVINRRSFGWSMEMSLDFSQLIAALLLALIASIAAGLYPAYRMARTRPALALRGE